MIKTNVFTNRLVGAPDRKDTPDFMPGKRMTAAADSVPIQEYFPPASTNNLPPRGGT